MSGAIDRGAGMINVESIQRRGKAIGVALTADFAISDDVYAGPLHVANCEPCGIVLRLFEEWFRHAPDLARPHTRRQPAAQLLAIHQPIRLRIAADDGRRNELGHGHLGTLFPASIHLSRCLLDPSYSTDAIPAAAGRRPAAELTGAYWSLLELTGAYWSLLELTGAYPSALMNAASSSAWRSSNSGPRGTGGYLLYLTVDLFNCLSPSTSSMPTSGKNQGLWPPPKVLHPCCVDRCLGTLTAWLESFSVSWFSEAGPLLAFCGIAQVMQLITSCSIMYGGCLRKSA